MNSKKQKENIFLLIPIIFLCTLYPLITHLYLYDTGLEMYDWFDFTTQISDVFLGWKLVAMEITGVIMLVTFLYYLLAKRPKLKPNLILILFAGYMGLTLLSTITSEYSRYSWSGIYEQFEPMWCVMIYVLITLYIYTFVHEQSQIQTILLALAVGALIIGAIGALQFLGFDIVTSNIGKFFIVPPKYYDVDMNREGIAGLTYMTLYNPNYVGSYVSLLFPLLFVMAVYEKNCKRKILYVIDCILLYMSALGCDSDNARWGLTVVLFILIIVFFADTSMKRASCIKLSLVGFILIIGIQGYYISDIPLWRQSLIVAQQPVVSDEDTSAVAEEDMSTPPAPISTNLKGITTGDDSLQIDYGSDSFVLSFSFEDTQFYANISDLNGDSVSTEQTENMHFIITDSRFAGIEFYPVTYQDGGYGVELDIDGKAWYFSNTLDDRDGYYYYNEYGKFDKITTADNYLFENHGTFGNGRGFIWGETLALLKHTLFLGTGADSFILVFPQDNYVQKYLNGYDEMVISKPHNMFLQIGVQNGILALALFLIAILILLWRLWKARKTEESVPEIYSWKMGIGIGIIGYLFTGIVNDATICITPVFWCLVGLGVVLTELQLTKIKKTNTRKRKVVK